MAYPGTEFERAETEGTMPVQYLKLEVTLHNCNPIGENKSAKEIAQGIKEAISRVPGVGFDFEGHDIQVEIIESAGSAE